MLDALYLLHIRTFARACRLPQGRATNTGRPSARDVDLYLAGIVGTTVALHVSGARRPGASLSYEHDACLDRVHCLYNIT